MTTYRLEPAGLMDRTDQRVTQHAGALVRKIQPYGCPRNGTMGMCYVQRVDNDEFIGLVSLNSLVSTGININKPVTREQAEDMADAHAEGYHADLPREHCPECEDRPLRSYPKDG